MRVVIYGGRDWTDQARMDRELDALHAEHRFTVVINGTARGADRQAADWAKRRRIPVEPYRPNWAIGKAAGPYRNQNMITSGKPALGIEFPGGRGTRDMRQRLDRARIPVIEAAR